MDELQMLRDRHDALPGPSEEAVADARHRLQSHMRRPERMRANGRRSRRWELGLGLGLRLGLGAVLVAGGVAAVIVPLQGRDGGGDGGDGGDGPRQVNVAATEVLDRASRAAAAQPDLRPRADQFLYFESRAFQTSFSIKDGRATKAEERTYRKEWLSVNGRRAGVVQGTGGAAPLGTVWLCDNSADYERREAAAKAEGHQPRIDLTDPPVGCDNSPAAPSGLPTEPKAMRTWLYRHSEGGNPPDVQAFITIGDTIRTQYIRPSSLAAMFKAAATIPGVTVTRDVADLAGRKGIAVGQTWHGIRYEVIFDAKTYRFLGERQIVDHDDSIKPKGGKPEVSSTPTQGVREKQGTVMYASAQLRVAVADQPGKAPR
ncbi:CU044_5270 family protein [Actinomadura barringtoniae]|uniref:CU044_5270 family protein n=1 Tax=Actinomadura barringtoniae TaxID=1427535 RepID=A0A939PF28_9ACTN|nr:CU044_5270 family protein [Actinomadura barringtoniae]MBO2447346.1 CU044_5270 family protein [Actinomadura barringtoniae]